MFQTGHRQNVVAGAVLLQSHLLLQVIIEKSGNIQKTISDCSYTGRKVEKRILGLWAGSGQSRPSAHYTR